MVQVRSNANSMLKIKVEIGNLLRGELVIENIAVLIGPPRTGKSLLLRLIYDTLYYAERRIQPTDLRAIASEITRSREVIRLSIEGVADIECSNVEEEGVCNLSKHTEYIPKALYIPSNVEDIIKYGYTPPFEPFMEFLNLVILLKSGISYGYSEDMRKLIEIISRNDKILGHISLKSIRSRLYEELSDRVIPVELSSSAVVKLGFLEAVVIRGLLDNYSIVLMDEPEANLHPTEILRLALLLHGLARNDKKIVVATHDFLFLDAMTNAERLNKVFSTDIEPADVKLYILREGGIHEVNRITTVIRGYTDDMLKFYGISGY